MYPPVADSVASALTFSDVFNGNCKLLKVKAPGHLPQSQQASGNPGSRGVVLHWHNGMSKRLPLGVGQQ